MHDCDALTHIYVCFIATVSKGLEPEGRLKNTVIPVQFE